MNTKLLRTFLSGALAAALALGLWPASIAHAAPGDLDPTFDGDGKVTTGIVTGQDDIGFAVALQPDGKIVLAGFSASSGNADLAVARYNSDGSLDAGFDGDGMVTTAFGSSTDFGAAVALQLDGKIVVAGATFNGSDLDFAMARYNADGSLDAGFDGDGMVTTGIGANTADTGEAVALQPDGKIVVAGTSASGGNEDFAVARYNADGSLDTTFDTDGKVVTPVGSGADQGVAVALQPDGKIVVAGQSHNGSNYDFAVVRYKADGSLDTTFDSDGKVTTPIGSGLDFGAAVALQPDGKIVVAGESSNDFAVARYNADGSLDLMFDADGKVTTPIGSGEDDGHAITLQPDGKIVVAGFSNSGFNNDDFAVVRYNADGSLDTAFDTDGKVTTAIGSGNDSGNAIALQPDGKIVVAGTSNNGSNDDFAVARYDVETGDALGRSALVGIVNLGDDVRSVNADNIIFPQVTLAGVNVTLGAFDRAWHARDTTFSGQGWHVTLAATDFSDGGTNTIPASNFFVQFADSDIYTVSGNTPPTSSVPAGAALNSTVTILTATAGNGMGTYNFVPHFALEVPGTTPSGNYTSGLTVTIVAGP